MFPGVYFGPRSFPPVYFGEGGSVTPTPVPPAVGGGGGWVDTRHWPPIAVPGTAYPRGVAARPGVGRATATGTAAPPDAVAMPLGVSASPGVGQARASVSVTARAHGARSLAARHADELAILLLLLQDGTTDDDDT